MGTVEREVEKREFRFVLSIGDGSREEEELLISIWFAWY